MQCNPTKTDQLQVSRTGIQGQFVVQYDVERSYTERQGGEIHVSIAAMEPNRDVSRTVMKSFSGHRRLLYPLLRSGDPAGAEETRRLRTGHERFHGGRQTGTNETGHGIHSGSVAARRLVQRHRVFLHGSGESRKSKLTMENGSESATMFFFRAWLRSCGT